MVTDKLIEHFPDVVDVNFTAYMEKELDDIAEGELAKVTDAPRVQRAVRARAREGRGLVRALPGGPRRALPALPEGRPRARTAAGQARPLRQVHRLPELPGVPLHPQHGRLRAAGAGPARRELPGMRPAAAAAGGAVRAVRRLQRLPGLPLHQEGAAEGHRRHLPRLHPGRARGEAHAVRAVLRLRPLPGVRRRGEQPADRGRAVPGVWRPAARPPEVDPVLDLRRRDGRGVRRHEVGRRRGRGRGARGQGRGEESSRRRARLEVEDRSRRSGPRRNGRPPRGRSRNPPPRSRRQLPSRRPGPRASTRRWQRSPRRSRRSAGRGPPP